jgi:hypothetical protein
MDDNKEALNIINKKLMREELLRILTNGELETIRKALQPETVDLRGMAVCGHPLPSNPLKQYWVDEGYSLAIDDIIKQHKGKVIV